MVWRLLFYFSVLVVLVPLGFLFFSWTQVDAEVFQHLQENLLGEAFRNTLGLLLTVCGFSLFIGYGAAWFQVKYRYFGASFVDVALVFPMAFPTYIYALGAQGFFGESFLDITWLQSGMAGSVFCLTAVLYPYVYLMSRTGLERIPGNLYQVASLANKKPWQVFTQMELPITLPWMSAGLLMVAMETLGDFGVASLYSFTVFTTLIYKSWFDLYSIQSAAQVASLLLFPALFLVFLDRRNRKQLEKYSGGSSLKNPAKTLDFKKGILALLVFSSLLLLFFLAPLGQLLFWAFKGLRVAAWGELALSLGHTLQLLLGALGSILILGWASASVLRLWPNRRNRFGSALVVLGYGVPGTLLAVALCLPFIQLENGILDFLEKFGVEYEGLLLSQTPFLLILGLSIRFLSLPVNGLDTTFKSIPKSLDQSAQLLGASQGKIMRKIWFPLARGPLLAIAFLVSLEVLKELPMVLMGRPMGFDPLAVKVFQFAVEGEWERAAVPALLLLGMGFVGVWVLWQKNRRETDVNS